MITHAPTSWSTGMSTALYLSGSSPFTSSEDREWTASGRHACPSENQSPCDAALAGFRRSQGFSKWSVGQCRARRSSRAIRDDAATHAASWHFDDGSLRALAGLGQRLVAPVFEHALNRVGQVFEGFLTGHSLPMRLGHFRAGCDEKRFTAFDDGCELVFHGGNLRFASRPINLQSHNSLIS